MLSRLPFFCRLSLRSFFPLTAVAALALALPATTSTALANISIVGTGTTSGGTYSLTGAAYTQSFDALPSSGSVAWANDSTLPGWSAALTTGTLNATLVIGDGTSNLADQRLASLGASGTSERALAFHTTQAANPTYLGLAFVNNSDSTLDSFTLSFTPEQWRENTTQRDVTLAVQYRVAATSSDLNATSGWTTINGLAATTASGSAGKTATLSATNVNVTLPVGSTIWFRWVTNIVTTTTTSSNDILAVDNVSVSFTAVPISGAPAITTQPVSQTVDPGASVAFTVVATGDAPLSYQWRKDNIDLSGATTDTLTLSNVQAADAASYTVVVSNTVSSAISNAATLTLNSTTPPVITTQPQSQTVTAGASVSFTVAATSSSPLSYQWMHGTTTIAGATSATLNLTNVQDADMGSYTVVVTNNAGSVPSDPATLTVNPLPPQAPVITTQPASQTVSTGGTAIFTVVATGIPAPTYQWKKDNNAISGATASTLTLANLQSSDQGSYTVVVSNGAGNVPSDAAILTVAAALPVTEFNLTGFATVGTGTTGGGVIAESDAAYRKVGTPQEFVQAVIDSNKTAGKVKVIEILNDLNLGWNEVGATVQGLLSNPLRSHATPKLHPTLIASGVSVLDIKAKSPLTIFSASGVTIKHVNFNIKGTSNIIIRNLKFDEMWEWDESSKGNYDSNDWDFITISNGGDVSNVWIDHCTFTKAYDGIVDLKAGTTNATLSWCRYIGDDGATNPNSAVRLQLAALEANKSSYAFYKFLRDTAGYTVDEIATVIQGHDKGHLMGSNSLKTENDSLTATFHHNWMKNIWDRAVPRLRGGNVHDYNLFVDDTEALAARRMRDNKAALLSSALQNTLNNTYSFRPPLNGAISTEGGSLLVEKSIYKDCLWPLRNNQTDVTNAAYTGKIKALDSIYSFLNPDNTTTLVRGNSTDDGNPMGPFQATIIPFAWDLAGGVLPYSYTTDDPAQLENILTLGAGAGVVTWSKDNWLKTTYTADTTPVAPTITRQPQAQTAAVGADATFTVQATGTGTLTYQWKKGGNNLSDGGRISGATSAVLTVSATDSTDIGSYSVIVTNDVGSTPSSAATLSVVAATAPAITTSPSSQTVTVGDAVSLSVVASGSAPLSYQWKKDNSDLVGATGATLDLPLVQLTDAGSYTVIVSNSVSSATSAAAVLTVNAVALQLPSITTQPQPQSVTVGASASFSVTAAGPAPFTYQWRKDGSPIANAISSSLVLTNVQSTAQGNYTVVVTNDAGSVTSDAAVLTVSDTPPVSGSALYVSPTGLAGNPGTFAQPTTLDQAILTIPAGGTIYVRGGTYVYSTQVTLDRGNSGSAGQMKHIVAYTPIGGTAEKPLFDFSSQPYGNPSNVSNPRGIWIGGDYWHLKGLEVNGSADNGIYIAGNNNIVEQCITHNNRDTGLQLGRYSSTALRSDWPSNNLILNCESYDNDDVAPGTGENADGFACKLTTGAGNVFRGCVSHNNIDDGWDLFTKSATGPIDPVVIDQCIAYNNGTLTNGTQNPAGDKNGFKLGGEDIAVVHYVSRCISFGNGKNGFTWNSNPGAIVLVNNLAWDNTEGNFKFDSGAATFYNNVSIWTTSTGAGNRVGINDRYAGASGAPTGASNIFWFKDSSSRGPSINDSGLSAYKTSFVTLTLPIGGFTRNADGSLNLGDFARPVANSPLLNAGVLPPTDVRDAFTYIATGYYEDAPDVGAVETYLHTAPTVVSAPQTQSVLTGASVTFSVSVQGTAPFTYQWKKDGSPIANATASTYTIAAAQASDMGGYTVTIANSVNSITSAAAVLTVVAPAAPTITTQPQSQSVSEGVSVQFSVAASGTAPFTYQWKKDGNILSGATSATYSIPNVALADHGDYAVVVTNGYGSDPSAPATLTVTAAPSAPTAAAAANLSDTGFTASWSTVSGATGYRLDVSASSSFANFLAGYQNLDVGADLSRAIAGLTSGTAYYYRVRAVHPSGTSPSSNVISAITTGAAATTVDVSTRTWFKSRTADVIAPNTTAKTVVFTEGQTSSSMYLTHLPAPISVAIGQKLIYTFTLQTGSTLPSTTNALRIGLFNTNGTTISANTSGDSNSAFVNDTGYMASFAFNTGLGALYGRTPGGTNDQLMGTTGQYTALNATTPSGTTGAFAPSTSYTFALTITRQAAATEVSLLVNGGAAASYLLTSVDTASGSFSTASFDEFAVRIAGGSGSIDNATISGLAYSIEAAGAIAPAITTQPLSQSVAAGTNVTLAVEVSGSAPFSYQWKKNGSPILNATSASLAFTGVTPEDAADYTVVVTNSADSVTSAAATLVVNATPPVAPTIAWDQPAAITYGTALGEAQLNATTSVPGTLVYAPAAGTLLGAGTDQTLRVTFTPTDSVHYTTATAEVRLTVTKAAQSVSLASLPSSIRVGTPFAIGATATSGLTPVIFSVVSGNATISGTTVTVNDSASVTLRASQAGDANYQPANTDVTFTASPAVAVAPTITAQPQGRTVEAGQSVTFAVTATGTPAPHYQWLKDGSAISGANAATFTIAETQASDAGSYTVLASNDAGSATSDPAALTVTVHQYAGIYFGHLGSGGDWALYVHSDNTGVFIAYLPQRHSALVLDLTIAADGSFSVTGSEIRPLTAPGAQAMSLGNSTRSTRAVATGGIALAGQITANGVAGRIDGLDDTFYGAVDASAGGSETRAGFYTAPALGTNTGATYTIIGASGQAVIVTTTPTLVAGGAGTVNDAGQLSVTTSDATQITVSVNPQSQGLSATVVPGGSTTPISFAGLPESVASTTRIVNLSARGDAGKDDKTLILGFVIAGAGSQEVVLRGIGPGLVPQGVPASSVIGDPQLHYFSNATGVQLGQNDDWGGSATLRDKFATLGAFALPAASKDAALATSFSAGVYSTYITTTAATSGIAMIEAYDATLSGDARFVNVSLRAEAKTGDDILIAGFVLAGNAPKKLLIRGVGPSLIAKGVSSSTVLQDPTLKLYHGPAVIAENDNWGGTTALKDAFHTVGAFDFDADTTKDAALLVTLEPGVYTVHIAGANNTTGVTLVEIYDVP